MARVETIVVGGGIGAGTPFQLNFVPIVGSVDPPLLITTDFMFTVPTGATRGLILNTAGTDPAAGPEVLRVKGGTILEPLSFDTGTAIGDGTDAGALGQILIGIAVTPGGGANNILIGNSVVGPAATLTCVAIGQGANLTGAAGGAVAIGQASVVSAGTGVAVGSGAQVTAAGTSHGIAIGNTAICSGANGSIAIGAGASVSGIGSTGVGANITVAGDNCVCIGGSASAGTSDNSIAIGAGANAWATQLCNIGTNVGLAAINTIAVGHGLDTAANPTAVLWRQTNASGTNNTAGAMTLQAGLSTGNIVGPGVKLNAGIPGASSATLQTTRTWVEARPTITATETGLMVWDVDNGTLERVTVGAAGSGGAGFKVLRIPD